MTLPHDDIFPNHPFLNPTFSDGFLSNFENAVHVGLPYPIHKPLTNSKIDIINKFHTKLTEQNEQMCELSEEFPAIKDRIMSQSFSESHVQVSRNMLDFCNKRGKCENASYSCDYNPFYGNCLECFQLNNVNYLVRPDCKNKLRITNIDEPQKCSKLCLIPENHHSITGISYSDTYLLLTLSNEINLIKIMDLGDPQKITWKKRLKKGILDAKYNKGRLGFVSASTKLRLYDVATNQKIDLEQDCNIGAATKLDFIDSSNIALLSEKDFKTVDLRAQLSKSFQPQLKSALCSMRIDDNTVYLASTEHLIYTDLRFFKNVEFCSHLMTKSPCYIDLVSTSEKKFLCLANQANETVLFSGNSAISSLPTFVPNICDTLTECQLTRDILLKDQLKNRLKKSTFGVKLLSCCDDVFLYSSNCLGDVFKQNISKAETDEAVTNLEKWVNQLPESKKTLRLTNITNLSHLRFALNKEPLHERLAHFRKKNKRAKFFLSHFQNVYNKNNVGNLVANFMAPWEEEEEEREAVDLVPEVEPIEKVNSWIQSSYFFD